MKAGVSSRSRSPSRSRAHAPPAWPRERAWLCAACAASVVCAASERACGACGAARSSCGQPLRADVPAALAAALLAAGARARAPEALVPRPWAYLGARPSRSLLVRCRGGGGGVAADVGRALAALVPDTADVMAVPGERDAAAAADDDDDAWAVVIATYADAVAAAAALAACHRVPDADGAGDDQGALWLRRGATAHVTFAADDAAAVAAAHHASLRAARDAAAAAARTSAAAAAALGRLPLVFESHGAAYALDTRLGLFYEPSRSFYYDSAARLYLCARSWQYAVLADAAAGSFALWAPPPPAGAPPASSAGAAAAAAAAAVTAAAALHAPPRDALLDVLVDGGGGGGGGGGDAAAARAPAAAGAALMARWRERAAVEERAEPDAPAGGAAATAMPAAVAAVCRLCRRGFSCDAALAKHEALSALHAASLAALHRGEIDADGAQVQSYTDRAGERRRMFGVAAELEVGPPRHKPPPPPPQAAPPRAPPRVVGVGASSAHPGLGSVTVVGGDL
jgi:hypothetical protein